MGDSKFFLIVASFLTAIVLSFQGCSGAIQTNGNGDPYEGVDTGDTYTIIDGTIDTPTSGNSGGSGGSEGGSGQNGGANGGNPPASNTPEPDLTGFTVIYECSEPGIHIDFVAFAKKNNGKKKILLRARDGNLKNYPWDPSVKKTNIFQPLSDSVLIQEVILKSNNEVKIYYFVNGESGERVLQTSCSAP